MKIHIESIHEGKMPFKYDFCDTSLSQSNNLNHYIVVFYEKKEGAKRIGISREDHYFEMIS